MHTELNLVMTLALALALGCGGGTDDLDSGAPVPDAGDTPRDSAVPDAGDTPRDSSVPEGDGGPRPPALTVYLTGSDDDVAVTPTGPGLVLMGGSTEVDAAFTWWNGYLGGGDVVILRVSGSDGYNPYLYFDIGGIDSVETLMVTTRALADSDYVAWRIRHAEGIFIAGGDQSDYVNLWKGSGVEEALMHAWGRGAVLGGTSAGLAILGEFVFAAFNGSVTSSEALADPYHTAVQLDRDFLAVPLLADVITDSHFSERGRMGRLIAFLARIVADGWSGAPLGLGIDERTALVVGPDGAGQVMGEGAVYLLTSNGTPTTCMAGVALEYGDLGVTELRDGDTLTLPGGTSPVGSRLVSATGGNTVPADPY